MDHDEVWAMTELLVMNPNAVKGCYRHAGSYLPAAAFTA
jgi:hypothetical protein